MVETPPADFQSPASAATALPGLAGLPLSPTTVALDLPMRWSETLKPCALAAVVASVLMSLGLNPFVAMLSVGFLAVVFYRQRQSGAAVRVATGVRLGALSGLLWVAIASILEALIVLFLHKGPEIRTELLVRIQQAASQTNDPQTLAMFDRLKTPAGLELLMVSGLILAFFASIVLAGLGGALGAAIFGRNSRS